MDWNRKRPWYKVLSVMLSLALTITLLSGCGTATSNQNDNKMPIEASVKEHQQSEAIQEEKSANSELAKTCEEVEDTLAQLEKDMEGESDNQPADTLAALEDQLAKTEEQTRQWLDAQDKVGEELSKDTAKVLAERNAAFEKQLVANQEQAQTLLSDIGAALDNGQEKEAAQLTNELKSLLVKEEEPKTYGETLPGEAEVQEAEVTELEATEAETVSVEDVVSEDASVESTKESLPVESTEVIAPVTLSEEQLSDLLVTEGDTTLNDELKAKAEELGTPLAVYNYIKNNIAYEYYYGSRKGAAGTYAAFGGNDIDQASLLIAMLRHIGVEAQYVRGTIYLEEEQALSLTGADTLEHAGDVLTAAGTPVTKLTRDGVVVKLSVEHVWVRAYVSYTDYRGSGKSSGDKVWIDLDTGIKAYEEVENLYDVMVEEGFSTEVESVVETGNITNLETMLDTWESKLSSMDLENVYARKRIIQQEELSYLPLSLQYEVKEEKETFSQTKKTDKDTISFSVGGESLGTYTSSELAGKDILLSFRPVSGADEEIFNSYDSIFNVPAHSVYMKPVLLIGGEVAAEGENIGTTLGTSQTFTMNIHSGIQNTKVSNTVTTGSMYAVTVDNQNITASELQRTYDEVEALKDSVTEGNVYSEEYLGKLLSLAGKLYFAQIDIADIMAAEVYDVSSVRTLSEGITGYEAKTTSLYGVVTGLSEGNLYIDIDTDSHNVISLTGEADAPREYMMATGMLSSVYEGIVWEQLTGYRGVSTISIFAQAKEENIDILLISQENLSTEIEKLNTDEITKQTVINAVSSGMIVAIPAQDVTIDEWSGTGYIITNPETGAGAYMITGGLNGGAIAVLTTIAVLCASILLVIFAEPIAVALAGILTTLISGTLTTIAILKLVFYIAAAFAWFVTWVSMLESYDDYIKTGDWDAAAEAANKAMWVGVEVVIDLFIDEILKLLGGGKPQGGSGDADGDNTPNGNGDADGGNKPDGDGDADGGSSSDGNGDSDGGSSSDGDSDGDGTSDGKNDGDNTSDGDGSDGNKTDGDTDDGNSSSGKGDVDDGGSTGNKGDADGGSTSGGSGDVDDGGSSGGTGTDNGGSSTGGDSGTDYTNGSTEPSGQPDILAKPGGTPTKIDYSKMDLETIRSLTRENEAADTLAKRGYNVIQNPKVAGNKNPDYLIEGRIFDCYSPKDATPVINVWRNIKSKIDAGQTNRIVLNLDDWHGGGGDIQEIIDLLKSNPINGLEEVIGIDHYHQVIKIY